MGKRNEKIRATRSCCPSKSSALLPKRTLLEARGKRADNFQAREIFLQHGVHRRYPHLHLDKQWLRDSPKDQKDDKGNGQNRQYHQRERRIGEPQNDEAGNEQQNRLQRQDETLTDEQADFFYVVRRSNHQLPRLVPVVITEREPLNFGKELIAKVVRHVLRHALCVERLNKGKDG